LTIVIDSMDEETETIVTQDMMNRMGLSPSPKLVQQIVQVGQKIRLRQGNYELTTLPVPNIKAYANFLRMMLTQPDASILDEFMHTMVGMASDDDAEKARHLASGVFKIRLSSASLNFDSYAM